MLSTAVLKGLCAQLAAWLLVRHIYMFESFMPPTMFQNLQVSRDSHQDLLILEETENTASLKRQAT